MFLYLRPGAHNDTAVSRPVGLFYRIPAQDQRTRGIIGSGDIFHKFVHCDVGVVDKGDGAVDDFPQVVGRYAGSHTHGYTFATVYQKIGKPRRKHDGLHKRVVEVGVKVHRLFVEVSQKFSGNLTQPRFGIPLRRRRIAVHGTEVSLSFHKRHVDGKVLRKSYQRVVNRTVAVGVIFTHDLAYDTGALFGGLVVGVVHIVHCIQYPSVNGFQSVSHIGNGTAYVDRHGVSNERLAHLLVYVYGYYFGFGKDFLNVV